VIDGNHICDKDVSSTAEREICELGGESGQRLYFARAYLRLFERLVVAAKLDAFCTDRECANYCIYCQDSYPIRSLTTAKKSLIAGRAQRSTGEGTAPVDPDFVISSNL